MIPPNQAYALATRASPPVRHSGMKHRMCPRCQSAVWYDKASEYLTSDTDTREARCDWMSDAVMQLPPVSPPHDRNICAPCMPCMTGKMLCHESSAFVVHCRCALISYYVPILNVMDPSRPSQVDLARLSRQFVNMNLKS